MRTIAGLGSITSSASLIRSEIAVRPDFARAADLGVTSSAIGETLRIATVGDYDTALPKLNLSQRQVPIVVKLDSNARQDLSLLGRLDALLDACHKRARPIVMTTLAVGAGMLPLAASWGAADNSFRSPMAVAVIGGLITSTLLSLLVIPSVFTVMDDFEQFMRRVKRWARREKPAGQMLLVVAKQKNPSNSFRNRFDETNY